VKSIVTPVAALALLADGAETVNKSYVILAAALSLP